MSKRKKSSSSSSLDDTESVCLDDSKERISVSSTSSTSEEKIDLSDDSVRLSCSSIEEDDEHTGRDYVENQDARDSSSDMEYGSTSNLHSDAARFNESTSSHLNVSNTHIWDVSSEAVKENINNSFSADTLPNLKDSILLPDDDLEFISDSDDEDGEGSVFGGSDSEVLQSESDDDDFDFSNFENPLIFTGANISVDDSMIAILTFAIRHKLSGQAIADLLKLIKLHCGSENNNFKASLYLFKKYFACKNSSPVFHYFCSSCSEKLPNHNAVCLNINAHPSCQLKSFFVELPLIPQIQALFRNEKFCKNSNYRFKRKKLNEENVEDIYDGQLYREQIESGFLNEENNFSFLIYGDGVPVFKSTSHGSLWPQYFSINELPYKMRVSKEYMLLGGLWYGGKPNVNLMLEPICKSLAAIRKGIPVKPSNSENEIIVKGILLVGIFDLPAKAMFLGMMQFNGKFGCQVCKIKGESVVIPCKPTKKTNSDTKRKKTTWVYKYSKDLDLRQHDETINYGREAQRLLSLNPNADVNVFGVKHPSLLVKLMYDAIRGTGIDDLHAIYLGIVGRLMSLWFDAKYSTEAYSLRKFVNVVNGRLAKVRPPNFIKREIRSIDDFAHWKGSEKKVWLLYLSVPVLSGIMKDEYIEHHALLVSAIHVLLTPSISPLDILLFGKKLEKYVQQFEVLYGPRHMLMNIHLMLHIIFVVNNLGPIWGYSCFPYESLNGDILNMIHGTRYVETQIASCAYLISQLPHAIKSIKSLEVQDFCLKLAHPSCRLAKRDVINENTFTVGNFSVVKSFSSDILSALKPLNIDIKNCSLFYKLRKENFLFVSRSYTRATKNISYIVSFKLNSEIVFGAIDIFIKVKCKCLTTCSCLSSYFAIIQEGKVEPVPLGSGLVLLSHIRKFSLSSNYLVVPVQDLQSMQFFVSCKKNCYVCSAPNFLQDE